MSWQPSSFATHSRIPGRHRDLVVRVAGYSDYFCALSRPLQDEIIARTEHRSV